MPELPEVQTVVSQLEKKITGKTIARFQSAWPKSVRPSLSAFQKGIARAKIRDVRRRGKHIVIDLDNSRSIVIHLKMTGHLLYKNKKNRNSKAFTDDPINGFLHHSFIFTDKSTLEFSDMRKFAWLRLMKTEEVESLPSIAELGIDALDSGLTFPKFRTLLSARRKHATGLILLEQNIIAGIGNIYRNEALFRAGILPPRIIGDLSTGEIKKLLLSLKAVLREALRKRGTSDGDFRDTDGLEGRFYKTLHVYRRHGKPCKICGTIISREKLGSRSIFFCSRCQK